VSPERLVDELAAWICDVADRTPDVARVAVDGPPPSAPGDLVDRLGAPLQSLGRRLVHVRSENFWRDASVRLEHGRDDPDEFLRWLDAGALRREVLSSGERYLPSLRDPVTNRATRAAARTLPPGAVLVVSGAFLLGAQLPFDAAVHLAVTASARRRRTPPALAWTLPAYDDYDARRQDDAGAGDRGPEAHRRGPRSTRG